MLCQCFSLCMCSCMHFSLACSRAFEVLDRLLLRIIPTSPKDIVRPYRMFLMHHPIVLRERGPQEMQDGGRRRTSACIPCVRLEGAGCTRCMGRGGDRWQERQDVWGGSAMVIWHWAGLALLRMLMGRGDSPPLFLLFACILRGDLNHAWCML